MPILTEFTSLNSFVKGMQKVLLMVGCDVAIDYRSH